MCGAAAAVLPVYKHRWACCPGCGNLSRAPRERLLVEALPAAARRRLPAALGWDAATLADPAGAWFRGMEERRAERAAFAAAEEARLEALGVPLGGAVLDVGGGPGELAARLARRAERVVLLEHAPSAVRFAREALGLDARPFDFAGAPLPEVAPGPWELLLCRFALGWCRDLERFVDGLGAVAAPGATLVLEWVAPSRGAALTSAAEDLAPWRLWSGDWLAATLTRRGWRVTGRHTPLPPMRFWAPRGPAYALASLPWALWPGPMPPGVHQRHEGLVAVR